MSNHLGNVIATVSNQLFRVSDDGEAEFSYYQSEIVTASDYSPFGMGMEGRDRDNSKYRFAFNGKESDDEWGSQIIQDYGFRLYAPGLGKFLSVDPLAPDYPWYTPYQFAGNTPIQAIDLDGLEGVKMPNGEIIGPMGVIDADNVRQTEETFKNVISSMFYGIIEGLFCIPNAVSNEHAGVNARKYGNTKRANELSAEAGAQYKMALIEILVGSVAYRLTKVVKVPNVQNLSSRTVKIFEADDLIGGTKSTIKRKVTVTGDDLTKVNSGYLTHDGILIMDIAVNKKGAGTAVFNDIFEKIGAQNIKEIRSVAQLDNLETVNKFVSEKYPDLAKHLTEGTDIPYTVFEDIAKQTFTYKVAKKLDFDTIKKGSTRIKFDKTGKVNQFDFSIEKKNN